MPAPPAPSAPADPTDTRQAHDGHYSYAVYADPRTATGFDAARFGGPIGKLLADTQELVLCRSLGSIDGCAIIDVGTGTGRAARALARRGGRVVAVDASDAMLAVARSYAERDGLSIEFARADAHVLPYPDRSFDCAVSLRVLMHTPDWRRCLAELCRVTRYKLVIDYPAVGSVAALQSSIRRLASALGAPTEPYRVFSRRAIERELARGGFAVRGIHRQFVLPIAVHKRIGSRRMTVRVEDLLARIGLLRLFGSPVTLLAERCAF
ncbi:MAG: class I SAM-dependent methyltransferase [Acidobacteria bacterium]|nr:class I SAM-dependent methyltransferase [Acidobacteriota bacterium]